MTIPELQIQFRWEATARASSMEKPKSIWPGARGQLKGRERMLLEGFIFMKFKNGTLKQKQLHAQCHLYKVKLYAAFAFAGFEQN